MTSFLLFLQMLPTQFDGADATTILGIIGGLAAVVTVLGSVIKTLAGVISANYTSRKHKALEGEKARKEFPASVTTADLAVQAAIIESMAEGTDELLRIARDSILTSNRSSEEMKRMYERLSAQARLLRELKKDQEHQQHYLEDLARSIEEIQRTTLVSAEVTRALHVFIASEVRNRVSASPPPAGLLDQGEIVRGPKRDG